MILELRTPRAQSQTYTSQLPLFSIKSCVYELRKAFEEPHVIFVFQNKVTTNEPYNQLFSGFIDTTDFLYSNTFFQI